MREMEWVFCQPLESTDLIEEFEKNANYTFPETYKEYVKKYAYGRPKGMVFKTEKYGDLTLRLCTFVKKSAFLNIWKANEFYYEFISYLEEKKEKDGLDSDEELELKKCKFVTQNYILFAACNIRGFALAFDKKSGKIIMIDDVNYEPLTSEVIADSFDEFIEEKLYKRERTGVYDDIEWNTYEPLKLESLIEEYEKKINYTFPESFKDCVKKYNGADSNDYVFSIDGYDETEFTFYSFNKEEKRSMWNLFPWYEVLEEFKGFKNNYVIFADNFFGNFLTFKKSNGAVVYWDHETMWHKTVGKSFDDFLSKMYLNKEILYIT